MDKWWDRFLWFVVVLLIFVCAIVEGFIDTVIWKLHELLPYGANW